MNGRRLVVFLPLLTALLPAQLPKAPPAYPERDILSPFRKCDEVYAPPDAVFRELRVMRQQVEQPGAKLQFDENGRQVCDDPVWQQARERLRRLTVDPGYLAEILRRSRNAEERGVALYGMFFADNAAHVLNLISHIPGEPEALARQQAYPRAIAFLRANVGRRFGDLSDDEKASLNLPEIGSPAANAAGLTRAPQDEDHLYTVNLRPFFQLLDLDSSIDQSQGLWFIKECLSIRRDLAKPWLEPALPRLRELLLSDQRAVRDQAIGVIASLAEPNATVPAAGEDDERILAWADKVTHDVFPPIRVVSEGLVLLYPGSEREAMATAGRDVLRRDAIGEAANGRTKNGQHYRGFRIGRIPDEMKDLPLKAGSVITAVNGTPIGDGKNLLAVLEGLLRKGADGAVRGNLMVEYVIDGEPRALEVRVM